MMMLAVSSIPFRNPVAFVESIMRELHDPANHLFQALARIGESPALPERPSWEQFVAAAPWIRQIIARRWQSLAHHDLKAWALLKRYEAINGAIDGPNPEREFDYDGDGGRNFMDEMRANHPSGVRIGSWQKLGDVLPVIAAPSIAPTADADTAADTPSPDTVPDLDALDRSLYSEAPETAEVGEDEDTSSKVERA